MLPPTSALVRQRGLSLLALADEQRPWAWQAHAALTGQDTPPRPSGAGSHRRDDRHKAVPLPMVRCARGRHEGTTLGSLTQNYFPTFDYVRSSTVGAAELRFCRWSSLAGKCPDWPFFGLTSFKVGGYRNGPRSSPVLARKPASSAARYCIRLSRVFTSAVSSVMVCLVRLASDRFRWAHTRSTGLSSWA